MKTFLGYMDSSMQWVGLAVLPPATSVGKPVARRRRRTTTPRRPPTRSFRSRITSRANGQLDNNIQPRADDQLPVQGSGQHRLRQRPRGGAGRARPARGRAGRSATSSSSSPTARRTRGPTYYSTTSPYRRQPCHQGVWSAATIKNKRHADLLDRLRPQRRSTAAQTSASRTTTGTTRCPSITAYSAICSRSPRDPDTFFNQPTPGQLKTIFGAIAADIGHGSSALIDDSVQ